MSAWTDVLDAIYEDPEFSVTLTLTPAAGGPAVDLLALPDLADKVDQYGQRRSVIERNVYRVRVHELAAKAPGFEPLKGDLVQVGDRQMRLVNAPIHEDVRRLEWRLDCQV